MEKKSLTSIIIIAALISILSLSGISFAGAYGVGCADAEYPDSADAGSLPISGSSILSNAIWDVLYSFDDTDPSHAGIETDGTYIYTPKWNDSTFHKFTMNGSFVEEFTIDGVSGIRDMAYDGTYFYGGTAGSTIYVMDMGNKTLVGTIAAGGSLTVRHIAYDPTLDGGNGGLWIGNWGQLGAVAMDGSLLCADLAPAPGSFYGSAYDPWSAGGPYLWLFSQAGDSKVMLYQFDIATKRMTGVLHDCSGAPGTDPIDAPSAGGAATYDNGEKGILLVDMQQSPNLLVAYELAETGKVQQSSQFFTIAKTRRLVQVNTLYSEISMQLPADVPAEISGLLDTAGAHMANASDTGNTIFANNELLAAIGLLEEIGSML